MECGDDSSGYLSHVMTTAMVTYAGTDWCSTGIPPQHFWPDFVKIATLLANYGVPVDRKSRCAGWPASHPTSTWSAPSPTAYTRSTSWRGGPGTPDRYAASTPTRLPPPVPP